MVDYLLVVVTHGAGERLDDVLASFRENVSPQPTEAVLVVDGPGRIPPGLDESWRIWGAVQQKGFCVTYERVWLAARETRLPFVFLLENDFVFRRPVEIGELAGLLAADPRLAQVALTRQAVNEREQEAGGLVEARPGEFEATVGEVDGRPVGWLRHRSFFTTNPCLFRSGLAREQPWPKYREHCEGIYGIQLRDAGYHFGLFGDGSPWVEHVGVRNGFGY